ncbi:hypothetical protein BY996DRAFT_6429425 [Phakopsora pachyrhizi]|uniref:DUF7872 domain-containing protein n=1 Tax=Phakopsora pachyrhizi TaxID=170000 RepID=A0AAV0AL09_PHAPC|nr:hypothetical protein BY996DRAFT_6429425 [Phakopsora pachyrhizi]CAH7668159.1 hypothetical protein PPACK8108_LOCUS2627 [Phakopsora pachyrhizi]
MTGFGPFGLGGTPTTMSDPCGEIKLTPQTWVDLDIDNYIAKYPNADKLTLSEFAAELQSPNFFCGVGMDCNAGQICKPVSGINWIILYAIQEWNNYMNSFYYGIEDAISLMRGAQSLFSFSFIPHARVDSSIYGWSIATIVLGALASASALAVPALLPVDAIEVTTRATAIGVGAPLLGAIGVPDAARAFKTRMAAQQYDEMVTALKADDAVKFDEMMNARNLEQVYDFVTSARASAPRREAQPSTSETKVGEGTSGTNNLRKRSTETHYNILHKRISKYTHGPKSSARLPSPYAFTRWTYLDTHLSELQNQLQSFVAMSMRLSTERPILEEGGIATSLKDGSFLYPNPTKFYLSEEVKALAQLTALSEFFKSIKMFVTIGSDDCKYKGPNGSWGHPEKLSFCTPEGLMMNIIRAEGNKAVNRTPNADLLQSKYGYSTEYLAKKAWECQKKYGIYTESKAPAPTSIKSDCAFAIPVCDCTIPEVARLRRHKHKMTTVKACRKGAGLPI